MKIKKLLEKNSVVKPLSVVVTAGPSLGYLGSQASEIFQTTPITGSDNLVAVSAELMVSFQGSLILFVLLLSVISVYKPPKGIIIALVVGGMALVASALLETIGMVLLTYGLGMIINSLTLSNIIERNNKLHNKKLDNDVDNILRRSKT